MGGIMQGMRKSALVSAAPKIAIDAKLAIPNHVAIIMDGNRRWAKERGLPVIEGHRAGHRAFKKIIERAFEWGIKELTFYAFSTENMHRPKEEVDALMNLARKFFKTELNNFMKQGLSLRVPGSREGLAADVVELIEEAVEKTKHNSRGIVNLCINYGGRLDILSAVKNLIRARVAATDVTEANFAAALSTNGMRDVDLVIRTSELRLSNFLPWESTYAELYFLPNTYWPDFDETEFDRAVDFFSSRQRRFGK